MVMPAKELMDIFNDLAVAAGKAEDFSGRMVYSQCENMVNNLMHGKTFSEIYPVLRNIFVGNSEADYVDDDEKIYYMKAVEQLDAFAVKQGIITL